jgi:predicted transposase YbfD/YdcC
LIALCAHRCSVSQDETTNLGHGRFECRRVTVWVVPRRAEFCDGWVGLQRVIRVERTRGLGAKQSHSTQYYISSLNSKSAQRFGHIIRSHWHIENRLHYPRDVVLHEDGCGQRDRTTAGNFATLRSIVFNVFRIADFESIKRAKLYCNNRIDRIAQMLLKT